MKNLLGNLIAVVAVIALISLVIWFNLWRMEECTSVGHSRLYCFFL